MPQKKLYQATRETHAVHGRVLAVESVASAKLVVAKCGGLQCPPRFSDIIAIGFKPKQRRIRAELVKVRAAMHLLAGLASPCRLHDRRDRGVAEVEEKREL